MPGRPSPLAGRHHRARDSLPRMQELETLDNQTHAGNDETREGDEQAELVDELLIEEISIDGMCGVY